MSHSDWDGKVTFFQHLTIYNSYHWQPRMTNMPIPPTLVIQPYNDKNLVKVLAKEAMNEAIKSITPRGMIDGSIEVKSDKVIKRNSDNNRQNYINMYNGIVNTLDNGVIQYGFIYFDQFIIGPTHISSEGICNSYRIVRANNPGELDNCLRVEYEGELLRMREKIDIILRA